MSQPSHLFALWRHSHAFRAALVALLVVTTILGSLGFREPSASAATFAGKIGAEATAPEFVDMIKSTRPFEGPQGGTIPTDARGWPLADTRTVVFDQRPVAAWFGLNEVDDPDRYHQDMSGVYKLSFTGQATITSGEEANAFTVANQVYDEATNTTKADIIQHPGKLLMVLVFTQTKLNPTDEPGTGIKNIRLIRPGYPENTTKLFTDRYIQHLQPYSTLRFMDWMEANHNPGYYGDPGHNALNWADRHVPEDATQLSSGKKYGVALEYLIQLANMTGKDIWINIPVAATNDYIQQAATLFKNELNPGIDIYLEHANEVWNFGFPQYTYNKMAAQDEVSQGNSNLDDGTTDVEEWARRRHARRVKEIGDIFASVFGSRERLRPVLAHWVISERIPEYGRMLKWLNTQYGAPSNYLYAISGTAYYNMGSAFSTGTVDQLIEGLQRNSDAGRASTQQLVNLANTYGLKYVNYEGGPDNGGGSRDNMANRVRALRDPRMRELTRHHVEDNYFSTGADLFMYFTSRGSNHRYGLWGATEDFNDMYTPQLLGLYDLMGMDLPEYGGGLRSFFYNTTDLSGTLAARRTDPTINFNWGEFSPAWNAATNADNFSVRWTGQTQAPVSGNYTFSTVSNGGVRVWINNQQVINNWEIHDEATDNAAPIALTAGEKVDIKIEFQDTTGTAGLKLLWSYPGQAQQVVPTRYLYPRTSAELSANPTLPLPYTTPTSAPTGTAIPAPTNLTATPGNGQVSLKWNPVSNVDGYTVYYTSGGNFSQVAAGLTTTSYTHNGLNNGTTYTYYVTAVKNGVNSVGSNSVSVTPSANAPTLTPTVTPGTGLLAYEPFGEDAGPLDATAGGYGWGDSWDVQNSDISIPGYNIANTKPLSYSTLGTSGNYAVGGDSYQNTGRTLDISPSGSFGPYLTNGQIGASGTTLWVSALLRKDVNNSDTNMVSLHNSSNTSCYDCASSKAAIGYFGGDSDNGGVRYWSLSVNGTVYRTSTPITIGQTALLVAKIEFGATTNFSLFVNPTLGSTPTSASATATAANFVFRTLGFYGGNGFNQSSVDEIRVGSSYGFVTPGQAATPTNTATTAPTMAPGTPTATNTPVPSIGDLLAYEPFAGTTGPLNATTGGSGWNSSGWDVQNGDISIPGYNITDATPLSYSTLTTSGNYAIGGDSYQSSGRGLDLSANGPFAEYLNAGQIGASGKTLWASALLRKDVNNSEAVFLSLHNNTVAWCYDCASQKVLVGYFGGDSDNNGTRYWSLNVNGTVYRTNKAITIGQAVLLVLKIELGGNVSLFVNPVIGSTPAASDAQATASEFAFRTVGYHGGNGFNQSSVDEIRIGSGYASVTPSNAPTPTNTPTNTPTSAPTNTPTTVPGSAVTLTPTDDRSSGGDDSGTNPVPPASQWTQFFMRFNLSGVSNVQSAKLRIYKTDNSNGLMVNVHDASSDNWSEATGTPSIGSIIQSVTASNAAGWVEFDVKNLVTAEAAGDDLVTFGITTNIGSWTGFSSKEGSNPPQLVINGGGTPGATSTPTVPATSTPTVPATTTPTTGPTEAPVPANTLRVYHVGNSVTDTINYNALKTLAQNGSKTYIFGRHMIPGASLDWIWDRGIDANGDGVPGDYSGFKEDPYGYYDTALPNYTWDVVTLQPFDRHLDSDVPYAKKYIDLALQKAENANTQFYVYQRWPRKNNDGTLDYDAKWLRTYTGNWDQTEESRDYFQKLLLQLRADRPNLAKPIHMVPVGDVLYELNQRAKAGQVPGLNSVNELYSDGIHFTNVGSFVVGSTFYATMYKSNPAGLSYASYDVIKASTDQDITDALANAIYDVIWDVVSTHPYAGIASGSTPTNTPTVVPTATTSPTPTSAPVTNVTVTVDKATQYQRIDGFGGFGAKLPWWSNAPFYDQAFVDRLIDDLGITVIRDEIPTDFEITNDNNDPFVTDLSKFNLNVEYRSDSCKSQSAPLGQHFDYLIALKNKAAAQGSELKMIASTWSPPYWMKYTKCIFGLDATWNRLVMREILSGENPNDLRDEYAEMLVAYVKTVKQATGIDIYAISVQNEPAFPEPYQSAVYSPAQLAETIRVVGERFEEEGLETKIFMPEDVTDYARVSGFVTAAMDSEARQYVDIMAAHGYGPDGATADGTNAEGWTQFQSLAGRYNLPLWMTETSGYQNNTAGSIQLAQAMLGGLKHGKLNAWVWWALSDVSVSNFGLMDKGTPTSLYYASKQFYRYIRPGAIHVAASATDAKTQVIAFAHPTTKQLTIVAINGESTAKSVSLDINGGSVPTSFEVIRTSASEQAKSLGTVAASEAILLPANSITTLVGTAPAADAPVAPKISSQPQSVAVNEGAVATFRVEANGTPDLSYQWYRNGVAMAGANGTSYTLTATAADNGAKFTVKVSSAHGNVTSSAATLTVNAFTGMSIVKTAQAPAIDGSIDAGWASAQGVDMSKVVMDIWPPSEIDNAADFDGSAKLLWDNQNLYLLYQITDQTVTITDSVELILDIDNSKDTAYGANDFQFAFGSNGTATEYKHNATTGVTAVSKPVQGGYVVEAKIPWATVGGTLAQGALIGLDVNANDIDVTNREAKIAWFSASNEIWHDPSLAGVGKLVGGTNTPTATPTDAPTSTPTTAPTSTPTTAPTSTPTTAPTSTPTNTAVPTSTPVPLAVKPVLECVVKDKDNKYLARFSYTNPNDYTITIPVGPRNKFAPSPENRGQPTTFVAGQQQGVFEVPMVKEVTWTLDGTSVTASKDMKQLCK